MSRNSTEITQLIGTAAAAKDLGITQRHVSRLVETGELVPVHRMPGRLGMILFTPDEIDRVKDLRASRKDDAK